MSNSNSIQIYKQNPRYWQYKGNPILLLGGTDDDNVFNWPSRQEVTAHLDLLASVGGNYDRCVISSRDEGNVKPFKLLNSGKFDLNQWEPEFWNRLDFYLDECEKRGIVAQIETWATYDIANERSPFNPANNVNEDMANSTFQFVNGADRTRAEQRQMRKIFYSSVPALNNDEALLKYLRIFMDKLLSHTLPRPNVLYCVDNEYNYEMPLEWYRYWAEYMHEKASQAGKTIHITQMNQVDWPILLKTRRGKPLDKKDKKRLGGDWNCVLTTNHREVYDRPEIFSFIDAADSLGNSSPTEHWEQLASIYDYIAENPRPINNNKLYGNDHDRLWGKREAINTYWRGLIGGCASIRFHRPPGGIGLSPLAQTCIRGMHEFAELITPWECAPRMDLLLDRGPNPVHVMAKEGKVYGVFFPGNVGGNEYARLKMPPGGNNYVAKWLNVSTGEWKEDRFRIGQWLCLNAPPWVSEFGWAVAVIRE